MDGGVQVGSPSRSRGFGGEGDSVLWAGVGPSLNWGKPYEMRGAVWEQGRWRLPRGGVLTRENVLITVLALVLWPLPFQPLVQVLHLLLLQTLRDKKGKWNPGPNTGNLGW